MTPLRATILRKLHLKLYFNFILNFCSNHGCNPTKLSGMIHKALLNPWKKWLNFGDCQLKVKVTVEGQKVKKKVRKVVKYLFMDGFWPNLMEMYNFNLRKIFGMWPWPLILKVKVKFWKFSVLHLFQWNFDRKVWIY